MTTEELHQLLIDWGQDPQVFPESYDKPFRKSYYRLPNFDSIGSSLSYQGYEESTGENLISLFKKLGYKTGAEIGVWRGDLSKHLLENLEGHIYLVDPWQSRNEIYESVLEKLEKFPNRQIIRKTSLEAAQDIADEFLDFVYIDADHRYRYIRDDLYIWQSRVRTGGIVSGHDFSKPTIEKALFEFTGKFNISKFYIAEDSNDWFFLKQ